MHTDRKAAIVLARMDSERFPGKALHPIARKPLIYYCTVPLLGSKCFDVLLATSNRPVDDPLANFAKQYGIKCFRGDASNVSKRVVDCIEHFNIDYFARINGDSPFVRRALIEDAFFTLQSGGFDFVSNLTPRTFPYGISVETFHSEIFLKFKNILVTDKYREHFTKYFYDHLEHFRFKSITLDHNYSDVRLTVDYEPDIMTVEYIIEHCHDISNVSIEQLAATYHTYHKRHN